MCLFCLAAALSHWTVAVAIPVAAKAAVTGASAAIATQLILGG